MAYGRSNDDVIDDVTWPSEFMVVILISLRPVISYKIHLADICTLWAPFSLLCRPTSGFVNDVMFHLMGPMGSTFATAATSLHCRLRDNAQLCGPFSFFDRKRCLWSWPSNVTHILYMVKVKQCTEHLDKGHFVRKWLPKHRIMTQDYRHTHTPDRPSAVPGPLLKWSVK